MAFAALAILGNLSSLWNGELFWSGYDPYTLYNQNPGIRAIAIAALGLAGLTTLLLVRALRRQEVSHPIQRGILWACALGALLPYLELWWGSTFHYGEIRDKQGLPFGVVFGGPLGSAVFLTYVLSRSGAQLGAGWRRRALLLAAVPALIWVQVVALRYLEEAWNLGQS